MIFVVVVGILLYVFGEIFIKKYFDFELDISSLKFINVFDKFVDEYIEYVFVYDIEFVDEIKESFD